MGYKEIEVSFPVANQTEFDFTRRLIEDDNAIPADVTIQVCSPCRRDTIARSIESLKGAKSATLFTYIPTSDNLRDNVLEISEEEGLQRAIDCTRYARSLTKDDPSTQGTHWTFGFGFEDFGNTRIELALRYSEAILSAWNPSTENPMIQGFATSVEVTAPNVFADQIECFLRKHTQRHRFILSVHPHNDRGCGVAAAELGCLAGADSIEGCLFGNGERAGNVDLVTLGLNLFTQGIDPGIDFSFLPLVRDTVEDITKIPVHPRAPYAGEYYFRAFSGLHQNAIIKSLDKRKNQQRISSTKRCGENASDQSWKVSYLPMDPTDIGLGYESIIKINSQSGGRGVAWSLRDGLGIELPRDLQIEFSKAVKTKSEVLGREVNRGEVADLFVEKYGIDGFQSRMLAIRTTDPKSDPVIIDLEQLRRQGTNDEGGFLFSVAAYISHIGVSDVSIIDTVKQAITMEDTTTPKTACYTQCRFSGTEKVCWGVGISDDERTAEINSILSALQVLDCSPRPERWLT